jgi:hypothetical protein
MMLDQNRNKFHLRVSSFLKRVLVLSQLTAFRFQLRAYTGTKLCNGLLPHIPVDPFDLNAVLTDTGVFLETTRSASAHELIGFHCSILLVVVTSAQAPYPDARTVAKKAVEKFYP